MSVIEHALIEEVARGLYGGDDWDQRHETWDPGMVADWMKRAETAIRVVRAADSPGAVGGFERVAQLAEWIHRDRRESDTMLMYAQELANLAQAHGGQ